MIISHKHRFIFLKTNKTAGTSIEIALSKICGDDAIITPISPDDEAKRQALGHRGPQNYKKPLTEYRFKDWIKRLLGKDVAPIYYNHISAKEVKQAIGDDIWNSYYKFCFERNPWDRVISHYYWHYKTEPRPSIAEYLKTDFPKKLKLRGIGNYTIDNEVVVDKIYRFENLNEQMKQLMSDLNIDTELELPRTKAGTRKDKRSYRDILSDEERDLVADMFKDEIALLGYEF